MTAWLLFVAGAVILGLVVTRRPHSPRARFAGHLVALWMMYWATTQAWQVVGAALSWTGPEPATAMGFACLLGAGATLAAAMILPAGTPRPRSPAVMIAVLAGVLLAGASAGLGLRKAVTDLSPVLSVTAEAPAMVPGMPGPLPNDTVKGELVATFTSSDLTGDVQVNPGARGPILSDDNTVIAVDGATGEQLWQHQLQNRKAHFWPMGRLMTEGWDDRLVLSPDGTAVALGVCGEQQGVLTVLDGLTGRVRFTRSHPCAPGQLSVTDHVVVVDRTAYDIRTGEHAWEAERTESFLPGTNTSSRLVVLPDISAADDPVPGCKHCIVTPVPVVSDQDPNKVVAQLDRAVRDEELPRLHRGWTLVHDPSDGSNRWVDVETLETRQAPVGDPRMGSTHSLVGIPNFSVRSLDEEATVTRHALDSWSRRVWEFPVAAEANADSLGENVWVLNARDGVTELTLITGDGEPLGSSIPLPTAGSAGSWKVRTSIRTLDGGASLLGSTDKSEKARPVLLVIYR